MDIKITQAGESCVVGVAGEIDIYSAHRLKEAIGSAAAARGCPLVLSLRRVTYIDSSGVGALLSINAALGRQSLPFQIVHIPGAVMKVLELTRLVDFLPLKLDNPPVTPKTARTH